MLMILPQVIQFRVVLAAEAMPELSLLQPSLTARSSSSFGPGPRQLGVVLEDEEDDDLPPPQLFTGQERNISAGTTDLLDVVMLDPLNDLGVVVEDHEQDMDMSPTASCAPTMEPQSPLGSASAVSSVHPSPSGEGFAVARASPLSTNSPGFLASTSGFLASLAFEALTLGQEQQDSPSTPEQAVEKSVKFADELPGTRDGDWLLGLGGEATEADNVSAVDNAKEEQPALCTPAPATLQRATRGCQEPLKMKKIPQPTHEEKLHAPWLASYGKIGRASDQFRNMPDPKNCFRPPPRGGPPGGGLPLSRAVSAMPQMRRARTCADHEDYSDEDSDCSYEDEEVDDLAPVALTRCLTTTCADRPRRTRRPRRHHDEEDDGLLPPPLAPSLTRSFTTGGPSRAVSGPAVGNYGGYEYDEEEEEGDLDPNNRPPSVAELCRGVTCAATPQHW